MKWHLAALAAVATLGGATPALADNITLHGMWNDRPASKSGKSSGFSLFGGPSYLGATPKLAAYNPYKLKTLPAAKPIELADGGERPEIKAKEPELVQLVSNEFSSEYGPGSIIVDTAKRKLYYILSPQLAYSYPIAVGKEGFSWTGTETVSKVVEWPEWMPPDEMRVRKPALPIKMTGGLQESARRPRHLSRQIALSHPRHQRSGLDWLGLVVGVLSHAQQARDALGRPGHGEEDQDLCAEKRTEGHVGAVESAGEGKGEESASRRPAFDRVRY